MKIKDKKEIKQDDVEPLKEYESSLPEVDTVELLRKQSKEIQNAFANRSEWQAKQNKWFRQRYGVRNKAVFPWYNASSQHLPMQDMTIRKFKPEYVAVAYNSLPMCELTPSPTAIEQNSNPKLTADNLNMSEHVSWHFDWLLRTRMDVFEPVVLMVDTMLHKGFAIVKTVYSKEKEAKIETVYKDELQKELLKNLKDKTQISILTDQTRQTELAALIARTYGFDPDDMNDYAKVMNICSEIYKGTPVIEFMVEETIYDAPKWIVIDPEDIIVPSETVSTFDLEKAGWIAHQYYITPQQLIKNKLTGKWDADAVDSLARKYGIYDDNLKDTKYKTSGQSIKDTSSMEQKRKKEGLTQDPAYKPIKIFEVCLWFDSDNDGIEERHVLEFADGQDKVLRFIRYPYGMRMWPYVKVIFELAESRHYSNRGTVEIEEPLASALNVQHNMKINRQTISSTPTLLYAANKINPNNMQYIPGQAVPIEPPIDQNAKYFMPPNTDQTFMQEESILQAWDTNYMAVNDFGNMDETATKTKYNANSRVGIRTLDIQIFQKALKEIYKRTFLLWLEFSSEPVFPYVDTDGTTKFIDKTALTHDYMFQPMGSFGSSNPQLAAQIAQRMFEEFNGDKDIDQYELKREYIMKMSDARTLKRLLKSKQQIQKDDQQAEMARQKQLQEQVALARAGVQIKADGNPSVKKDRRGMQQIGRQRA